MKFSSSKFCAPLVNVMLCGFREVTRFFKISRSRVKNHISPCDHISPLIFNSCNFFIFHRNTFLSYMSLKYKYVFTQHLQRNDKLSLSTLKIIMVKCGEIWFPWRNMVLCSISKQATYLHRALSFVHFS